MDAEHRTISNTKAYALFMNQKNYTSFQRQTKFIYKKLNYPQSQKLIKLLIQLIQVFLNQFFLLSQREQIFVKYYLSIQILIMSFTTLRQDIGHWTLYEDDQLFKAVKSLSDAIFESQKQITQNISDTKYALHEGNVNFGFRLNQFMRLSEFKFTENKIQQRVDEEKNLQKQETKAQKRPRMDLMKEALSIGLKNIDIKDQDPDKDNISIASVSEYSFSMSQAVYKYTRLPPLFGTKQFATQPYLNLFTNEDANQLTQTRKSISNAQILAQIQFTSSQPQSSDSLPPPPPPIEQVLRAITETFLPPPPPPLDQVLRQNTEPGIRIQQQNIGFLPTNDKQALPPIPFNSHQSVIYNKEIHTIDVKASFTSTSGFPTQFEEVPPPVEPPPKKPMSIQDQLNLRLAKGKNYKQFMPITESSAQDQTSSRATQQSIVSQKQYKVQISSSYSNMPRQTANSQPAIPYQVLPPPLPPVREPTKSQYSKPTEAGARNSVNYNQILNQDTRFGEPSIHKKVLPVQQEEQQQNALFVRRKTRKVQPLPTVSQEQLKRKRQEQEQLMKKSTFNDDSLFVKKKNPAAAVLMGKKKDNKLNLLQEEQEQQEKPVELKKPVRQEKPKPSPQVVKKVQQKIPEKKQVKNLFNNDQDQEPIIKAVQKKPTPVKVNPTATGKSKNLFDDDEDNDDLFKKKVQKPKQIKKATASKPVKNILIDAEDSDQDFKKKKLPAIPTAQKKQQKLPALKIQTGEKILKPKEEASPVKKQQIQSKSNVIPEKQQIKSKNVQSNLQDDFGQVRRKKNKAHLSDKLFDENQQQPPAKVAPKQIAKPKQMPLFQQQEPLITQKKPKITQPVAQNQDNQEEQIIPAKKDPKKMGGIGIFGGAMVGPVIPKGMVLSKPSEIKNQQKIAIQKQEQQNQRQKANLQKEQQMRLEAQQNQKRQEIQRQKNEAQRQQIKRLEKQAEQENQAAILMQQEQARIDRMNNQRQQQFKREFQQKSRRQSQERQRKEQLQREQQLRQEQIRIQEEQQRNLRYEQEEIRKKDLARKQEQRKKLLQQQKRQAQEQERRQKQRILKLQQQNKIRQEKQRIQREQQQRRRIQQENRLYIQQQQRLQRQQNKRILKEQQQRIRRQQQQQKMREEQEKIWRQQQEKKYRQEQERVWRQEQQRKWRQQQERKWRQEKQKQQREKRQRQERERLQKEQAQRKIQQQNMKKTPLGGLVPKLPTKKGPTALPAIGLPGKNQPKAKKGLFDDNDDDQSPVAPVKKPAASKPAASSLFNDDEEGGMDFTFKSKQAKKPAKANLFDDEDDIKMPVAKKQPTKEVKKQGLFDDDESPSLPKAQPVKAQPKKNTLFDDDDQRQDIKVVKKTVAQPVQRQPEFIPQKQYARQEPQKPIETAKSKAPAKKLLQEDDEEEFNIKPVKQNNIQVRKVEQVPQPVKAKPPAKKANTLFDQQEDSDMFASKKSKPAPAAAAKKPGLLFNDDQGDSFMPVKKAPAKPAAKPSSSLFNDDQQPMPKPATKPARNKKALFDDD